MRKLTETKYPLKQIKWNENKILLMARIQSSSWNSKKYKKTDTWRNSEDQTVKTLCVKQSR